MSDQPKTTTGEWECPECHARDVSNVGRCGDLQGCSRPNVIPIPTTTGEWTANVQEAIDMMNRRCDLALDEDERTEITTILHALITAALAAEKAREEHDWGHVKREYLRLQKENKQLRDQLAEDKSVLKPLVDELTRMSFSYLATADELRQMSRDALAKAKEGK